MASAVVEVSRGRKGLPKAWPSGFSLHNAPQMAESRLVRILPSPSDAEALGSSSGNKTEHTSVKTRAHYSSQHKIQHYGTGTFLQDSHNLQNFPFWFQLLYSLNSYLVIKRQRFGKV